MRPIFRPLPRVVIIFSLCLFSTFVLAVDKKRKSTEIGALSKKTTPTQKNGRQVNATRESGKKKEVGVRKQQLARQKKDADKQDKKRGKDIGRQLAKQRDPHASGKKNARLEADKKNEKTKDKVAKREIEKRVGKNEKAGTKKQSPERATNPANSEAQSRLAAAKMKSVQPLPKQESLRVVENASSKMDAKAKADFKVALHAPTKEEKIKELPAVKYSLRPIAKVVPKVELKFSVARATTGNSFDAPPPQDIGPDVIDVIEHNSPEANRLDDVLRSEMKTLKFSGVPSNSRKKIDVGKMDIERIKQIQEALAKKGYYSGEIHGQYDDVTIEAMRKFQETNKIDVTGYTTAQSLRLLGLTDW